MQMNDHFFMQRCLQLAAEAKKNGKTAVGAVMVKDNNIIAEGWEGESLLPDILGHAEIVAIVKAIEKLNTKDLSLCTMYTTVEPCFMCSYLIRETQIARVVFGAKAGDIGGVHSNFPLLGTTAIGRWKKSVATEGGMLEKECLQFLQKVKG